MSRLLEARLLEALRIRSKATAEAEAIKQKAREKAIAEKAEEKEKPVVIFMRLHVPMGYRPKRDSMKKAVALRN